MKMECKNRWLYLLPLAWMYAVSGCSNGGSNGGFLTRALHLNIRWGGAAAARAAANSPDAAQSADVVLKGGAPDGTDMPLRAERNNAPSNTVVTYNFPNGVRVGSHPLAVTFYSAPGGSDGGGGIVAVINQTVNIGSNTSDPLTVDVYPDANSPGQTVPNSVTLNPTNVNGGSSSTGTVTISNPAPSDGISVALTSDNTAAATVPASVTVASGATTATFTVTTTPVVSDQTANISATYNGTKVSAALSVKQARPLTLNVAPTSVFGGNPSAGTVTLTSPAPSGGLSVALSSDNASATVPPNITVAQGATTATFTATTSVVGADQTANISAKAGGTTVTAALQVKTAQLMSLAFNPTTSPPRATSVNLVVTLTSAAPSGGAVVALSSNPPNIIANPATVTVPAGQTTSTFTLPVNQNQSSFSTPVTVTGTLNGLNRSATITINP